MPSPKPTRWATHCREHGKVYMTFAEYENAMARPNERWKCPVCGALASFDDDQYEFWNPNQEDA